MTAESMRKKGEETKAKIEKLLTTRPKSPLHLGTRAKLATWSARAILVKLAAEGRAEVVKVGRSKHYRKPVQPSPA